MTEAEGFCANCGAARPTGAAFCPACGQSYAAAVTARPTPPPGWGGSAAPKAVGKRGSAVGKIITLVIAVIVVGAIYNYATKPDGGTGATTQPPAAAVDAGGVQWADYAPSIRSTIDAEAASRDCAALQASFNSADANNVATMTRTGHNNAALMVYIDGGMRSAGCY